MKGYYVTVIRGKRVGWLLGPFDAHEDALAKVDLARTMACRIDPWCDFDAFGTTRLERPEGRILPPGKLNGLIGVP